MSRGRYEGYMQGSATWNPAQMTVSTSDATSVNVTVAGATMGDFAIASFSNDVVDCVLDAQVTAANTVSVVVGYLHDATVDLGSGTLRVRVFPF